MRHLPRLGRAAGLAFALAAVSAYGSRPAAPPRSVPASASGTPAPLDLGPDVAGFYLARDFRPLWIKQGGIGPAGQRLVRALRRAGRMNRDLDHALAAAKAGDRRALARADLLLSRAYVDRLTELHRAPALTAMRYVDSGLAPEPLEADEWLDRAAAAPDLDAEVERALRTNPALDGLMQGLAAYRARWSRLPRVEIGSGPTLAPGARGERVKRLRWRLGLGTGTFDPALAQRLAEFQRVHGLPTTGRADPETVAALDRGAGHYERLILANIERARAIPARPQRRYILVDAASARLWMVEDGRLSGSMRVVVGKADMQTPAMAGLIRYAVLNPYWNLPPDLIRDRARKALRRGPGAIATERLQILSDWSSRARPLSPRQVNWREVASGRRYVNLRQRPGPHNMMGAVKFMMPNDLGIYLHDTPLKTHFTRDDRRISSGCVRLEDAPRLARWLFGGTAPRPSGAAEQRVDLPEPVPVYITYLTALPSRGGIVFVPDRYGRDSTLLARLDRLEAPAARGG